MEAKEFMELFDSYWFEKGILKKHSNSSSFLSFDQNPGPQIEGEEEKKELFGVPGMISRTTSDQLWPKMNLGSGFSMSPDSVLLTPKLQTILSGKEVTDEEGEMGNSIPTSTEPQNSPKKNEGRSSSRRTGKKKLSKSFSELEFEELKGFMDLGFVFSEEDKDSKLVSIIPGLQRLGKKEGDNETAAVARPYLSEAWEELDKKKKQEPLMNWRIPSVTNEIDMKDNLKFWAHTVASAVR